MLKTTSVIKNDEVFIPTDEKGNGIILQNHELEVNRINREPLVNINQYQVIRKAQELRGYVMSTAEEHYAHFYAKKHQEEDQRLKKYYESITSGIRIARFNRTQLHNLKGINPLVVNIEKVHKEYDLVIKYEERVTPVSWLPKKRGYVQEFDEETGLPKSVGDTPVKELDNIYFFIDPSLDTVAAVRLLYGSWPYLNLDRGPGFASDWLGVRVAKKISLENLEEKL